MSKKDEYLAIINALQEKLGYPNIGYFQSLNGGEAPNSCTILDTHTSKVWKIARNRPEINPRLELRALEALPDECINVVKHLDSGELEVGGSRYFYLVFPHIEGVSLRTSIRNHIDGKTTFSFDEIKNIGDSITKAICFLNEYDLVHQDIKPDNIIVQPNGSALLIDLGIAMFITDSPKKLKKLEGPYAYMSPEKLSVIGNGQFRQWSKLNYTSDLFSLGLILLEMATLRRVNGDLEPDLAKLYKVAEMIPGLEVEEDVKTYIAPFLQSSQYDRHISVMTTTSSLSEETASVKNFRLWLHSSSKSVNLIDSFLGEHDFKSNFGLIYKAEQASSISNIDKIIERGALVIAKGGEFALDPSTYLQVYDKAHHRGTKYFEFAGLVDVGLIVNPPKFAPGGYMENYVKLVIGAQTDVGVSTYISPYLYLENIEGEAIEANFLLWNATSHHLNSLTLNKPTYFGLLISERLVNSKQELMELAFMVTNQRYAKNIYLRVESDRPQSQPLWDRGYLENLRDFVSYLSLSKSVLLANSGLEGIGYLCHGLCEVSTNPFFSQRKFLLKDKLSTQGGGTEPAPRYFAKKLLNEVLVPQEVDTLIGAHPTIEPIFHCDCPHCPSRDKESLAKHFLIQYDDMFAEISTEALSGVHDKFMEWLDLADNNYAELERSGAQFSTPTGSSFIPIWKQVF